MAEGLFLLFHDVGSSSNSRLFYFLTVYSSPVPPKMGMPNLCRMSRTSDNELHLTGHGASVASIVGQSPSSIKAANFLCLTALLHLQQIAPVNALIPLELFAAFLGNPPVPSSFRAACSFSQCFSCTFSNTLVRFQVSFLV